MSQNVARLVVSHRFDDKSGIGSLARAVVAEDAALAWAQFARFPEALGVWQGSRREQAEALYALHADYWQAVAGGDVAAAFAHQADAVVLAAGAMMRRRLTKPIGNACNATAVPAPMCRGLPGR